MGVYPRFVRDRDGEQGADAPSARPHESVGGRASAGAARSTHFGEVGQRVQEIVDAAERIALELRADAEADAAQHAEARKRDADRAYEDWVESLRETARSLSSHAASQQRAVAEFAAEIEDAIAQVSPLHDQKHARFDGNREHQPVHLHPVAYPGTNATGDNAAVPAAVLRATQMAVAGSPRADIERALREEHGIRDSAPLVDRVLDVQS